MPVPVQSVWGHAASRINVVHWIGHRRGGFSCRLRHHASAGVGRFHQSPIRERPSGRGTWGVSPESFLGATFWKGHLPLANTQHYNPSVVIRPSVGDGDCRWEDIRRKSPVGNRPSEAVRRRTSVGSLSDPWKKKVRMAQGEEWYRQWFDILPDWKICKIFDPI